MPKDTVTLVVSSKHAEALDLALSHYRDALERRRKVAVSMGLSPWGFESRQSRVNDLIQLLDSARDGVEYNG